MVSKVPFTESENPPEKPQRSTRGLRNDMAGAEKVRSPKRHNESPSTHGILGVSFWSPWGLDLSGAGHVEK